MLNANVSLRPSLLGLAAILASIPSQSCGPAYVAPCQLTERRALVSETLSASGLGLLGGAGITLLPQTDGRVIAAWWRPITAASPEEALEQFSKPQTARVVELAVMNPLKDEVERSSVMAALPEVDAKPPSGSADPRFIWVPGGVVVMGATADSTTDAGGVEHLRLKLVLRYTAAGGVAGPTVELPSTECTDCDLSWAARFMDGRLVVVFAQAARFSEPSGPLRFVTVREDGSEVLSSGELSWLTTSGVTLGRASLDVNPYAIELSSGVETYFVDASMNPVAGPFLSSAEDYRSWHWRPGSAVASGWSEGGNDGSVFMQLSEPSGQPSIDPRRISTGSQVERVTANDALAALVFRDAQGVFFAAITPDGRKLGGDVELIAASASTTVGAGGATEAASLYQIGRGSLTPTDSGFLYWSFSSTGIERLRISCEVSR